MDIELKSKWVDALRSGNFKQGAGYLEHDGKHCCLGVLCEIQDPEWKGLWEDGDDDLYTEKLPPKLGAGLESVVCEETRQYERQRQNLRADRRPH